MNRNVDSELSEYNVVFEGPKEIASNGLEYQRFVIKHKDRGWTHEGKRYDLTSLNVNDRKIFQEQVGRHADVSMEVSRDKKRYIHPVFGMVKNKEGSVLWVIQELIEGLTLDKYLKDGPYQGNAVALMLGIISGIKLLHGNGYIRRDLNPKSIVVEKSSGNPVLTDFELVKSMDSELPTVKTEDAWEDESYLDPVLVVDPHLNDLRVDLYSFGAIFFHVITGDKYRGAIDNTKLDQSLLGEDLWLLILRCLDRPEKRPSTSTLKKSLDDALKNKELCHGS